MLPDAYAAPSIQKPLSRVRRGFETLTRGADGHFIDMPSLCLRSPDTYGVRGFGLALLYRIWPVVDWFVCIAVERAREA